MARYETHDDIAVAALDLAVRVRESAPLELYRHLVHRCVRDPERMAQVLMCLAIWLDVDAPVHVLTERAEAICVNRAVLAGRRVSAP